MTQNVWAEALQECENPSRRDANLWAQCFAEAGGDESMAKAAYVKAKVLETQKAQKKAPDPRSGYCPTCSTECDMEATYCFSCHSNLTGALRPIRDKPSRPAGGASPTPEAHSFRLVKTAKSRGTYVIWGLLLGMLGMHNFYAGRFLRGGLQLASTVLLGWFVIGLVITCIWVFIDLFTVTTDGAGDAFA